jgi:hypothetical protein
MIKEKIALAIAAYEGFLRVGQKPTLGQRNLNPGNIRQWRGSDGKAYPRTAGYVNFYAWALEKHPENPIGFGVMEGWRVLLKLVGDYLEGKYTGGKRPSLIEMFRIYAPESDGNKPEEYARFVASMIGVDPEVPIPE